jgi:ACS family glucarate transporter-like MFS transporter
MLTGLAPNFLFMLSIRVAMGIGESTCWPACNRIIREWFPASERGFANAFLGAGASAGSALGAMGVSAIVSVWGWRTGFLAVGGVGFIWLIVWNFVFDQPERVNWLRPAERDKILWERDGNDDLGEAERPVSSLRYLLGLRSVWGLFLTQGCEVYGGYMLLTWLPSYLQQARGLSIMNAGMMTAIPFGTASVLAVLLGHVSDRILTKEAVHAGQRRITLAVLLAGAAGILVVPLLNSLCVIILVLTCVRTMGLTASGLIFALGTDLVRNRAGIAKVTSITAMGGNSFGLVSPIITGYIVSISGGSDNAFFVAGALNAMAEQRITTTLIAQHWNDR